MRNKSSFLNAGTYASVAVIMAAVLAWRSRAFCNEIHSAAKDGDVQKIRALLKNNPDLAHSTDELGDIPLHLAALNGHKEVVELLLANKAGIHARDNNGLTPLHYGALGGPMAMNGYPDVVELLLDKGASIDAKDKRGMTPLHAAVLAGRKDVVKLLLIKGADPDAMNSAGKMPIDLIGAVIEKKGTEELNSEMAALLRQYRDRKSATASATQPSASHAQNTLATAPPARPATTRPASKEEYGMIDGRTLGLVASIQATRVVQAADGSGDIKGNGRVSSGRGYGVRIRDKRDSAWRR